MYKIQETGKLAYLRDFLHYHPPAGTLRSSSQLLGLLSAGDENQFPIQGIHHQSTSCLFSFYENLKYKQKQ